MDLQVADRVIGEVEMVAYVRSDFVENIATMMVYSSSKRLSCVANILLFLTV